MHLAETVLVWCAAVGVAGYLGLQLLRVLVAILDIVLDGRAQRRRTQRLTEMQAEATKLREEYAVKRQEQLDAQDDERRAWARNLIAMDKAKAEAREAAKAAHPSSQG